LSGLINTQQRSEKPGKEKTGDLKMETVISAVRGDSLDPTNKPCIFCCKTTGHQLFGVTAGKKHDGVLLKTFSLCEEHLDKLNALLSGEFDIDLIQLEKYRKSSATLRFRG
jgi:hypothetical protein